MNDDTKQLNEQIQNLNTRIKELEQDIQMEKMVKKSEVMLNAQLLQRIEKLELHIETLIKINEEYSNMVAQLRLTIKKIISNPKID
jgi:chaperonin cofactor prefoldin